MTVRGELQLHFIVVHTEFNLVNLGPILHLDFHFVDIDPAQGTPDGVGASSSDTSRSPSSIFIIVFILFLNFTFRLVVAFMFVLYFHAQ